MGATRIMTKRRLVKVCFATYAPSCRPVDAVSMRGAGYKPGTREVDKDLQQASRTSPRSFSSAHGKIRDVRFKVKSI